MTILIAIFYWLMIILVGLFIVGSIIDFMVYRSGKGYFVYLMLLNAFNVYTIILLHRHNPYGIATFAGAFVIFRAGTWIHLYWVMLKNA